MSWIFGIAGNIESLRAEKISEIEKAAVQIFTGVNFKIFTGGNRSTLSFGLSQKKNFRWISAGTGFREHGGKFEQITDYEWEKIFSENKFSFPGGHYAAVRIIEKEIDLYTDRTGLRDFYLTERESAVIFSTRPDFIIPFARTEIDFEIFGSRWLLFNQISTESSLKNIHRIAAGRTAIIDITKPGFAINKNEWLPDSNGKIIREEDFSDELEAFIYALFKSGKHVTFSLSGGMDSRLILSYILSGNFKNWSSHTFGDALLPDAEIAKKLSDKFGFVHERFNLNVPENGDCISGIKDYIAETIVNNSASSACYLRHYNFIPANGGVNIDGGFGEIFRREFFYKLTVAGKNALLSLNAENILPHIIYDRGNIFNEEIRSVMFEGSKNQLDEIFQRLPENLKGNPENIADWFALKTRLVNYYGPEQSHLDGIVKSVMPLAQFSLLDKLFDIPVDLRKNGKLFRNILKRKGKRLTSIGLAKGNTVHPFRLNSFQSRVWSAINRKLITADYENDYQIRFLNKAEEFIRDTASSREVKESGIYDFKKITDLVESFYSGNTKSANSVDWFLSFEIFRRYLQDGR